MYLQKAIEKCRRHDSGGRCSVYAIALDKRGRIISEDGNRYLKSHPLAKSIAVRHGVPERDKLHAECKVLLGSRGRVVDTLVVARVDKNGNIKDGKPCVLCQDMLKYFEKVQGRKINVVYSRGE